MTVPPGILVWSASYGGGHARAAAAFASQLAARYGDRARVVTADVFDRHLPRAKPLAAVGYRNSETLFPDADGTLIDLARERPDDPVVREMSSGGLAGVEAAIEALDPAAVVSFHLLAAGMTAEVTRGGGRAAVAVLTDQAPGRMWLHPGTDLYCVANGEMRQALAARGVPWDRIAITGVPVPAGLKPATDRAAAKRLAGLADRPAAVVFPSSDRGSTARLLEAVAARGMQVVVASPEAGGPGAAPAEGDVRVVGYDEAVAMLPGADVAVCAGGGSALWTAPAAGVGLVIAAPVAAHEAANVDHLVNSGAALLARDAADAAERVAFLAERPDRSRRMGEDAAATSRPSAAAAVCERVLALLR